MAKVTHYTQQILESTAREYARQVCEFLPKATFLQAIRVYKTMSDQQKAEPAKQKLFYYVYRELSKVDRYFLFTRVLRRKEAYINWPDYGRVWLYERFREVEASPDSHLDFWARGHYKSSCITFAGSFQEIIKNPEITIGIFSHTKKIAKDFVQLIQIECTTNKALYLFWPDIFWENPEREAPSWSLDNGLIFKRKTNPRECTVEGWGLTDGQPIGKHFKLRIYDDVVTEKSVATADQILKTTKMFELSHSLSSPDRSGNRRIWIAGTRYHYADTYADLLEKKKYMPRIYPATKDGTPDGDLVLFAKNTWEETKQDNSEYNLACQYLMNPLAAGQQEFDPSWVRRYEVRPLTLNVYIKCDPAGSALKDNNCNTAFTVTGFDASRNKYLLDGACHKMTLSQRWDMLKTLRNKWLRQPGIQIVKVGYEKYGMQADIEHFKEMMKIEKSHFAIEELNWPQSGGHAKDTRIRRLIPDHQNWRYFYPYDPNTDDEIKDRQINKDGYTSSQAKAIAQGRAYLVAKPIMRKNHLGKLYNLVDWFLRNEYNLFPATNLKDMLDCLSRIYDMNPTPPMVEAEKHVLPDYDGDY